jgi:hypothetical protein
MAKGDDPCPVVVPTKVLPKFVRCAGIDLLGRKYDWIVPRLVAINSYYFYVLLLRKPIAEVPRDEVSDVDVSLPGELIQPGETSMLLSPSGPDALAMILPHVLSKREAYARHCNGKERRG